MTNFVRKEMTNFVRKEFLYELNCKLSRLFKNNSLSVNELFDRFVSIFTDTVDQFDPMRKATRKEKLQKKPWLTGGLLKLIKQKNNMYSRLHKNSNNAVYTTYRNCLNRIIRLAKRSYYHKVLDDCKGSSKKVWEIVNELMHNKKWCNPGPTQITTVAGSTVTEPQDIAEEFNKFFVYIGKSMSDSIEPDGSNTIGATSKPTNNFIFLYPSSPQEVCNIINELKDKKAKRTLDVETKFLKCVNPVISK